MDSWLYVDRFCYLPIPTDVSNSVEEGESHLEDKTDYGYLRLDITYEKQERLKLLFYWGTFESWLSIYSSPYSTLTCADREELAQHKVPLYSNSSAVKIVSPNNPDLLATHFRSEVTQYFYAEQVSRQLSKLLSKQFCEGDVARGTL